MDQQKKIKLLEDLCKKIYDAESKAQQERKRERFGDNFTELVVKRLDKVVIEIRKEKNHKTPHMHIKHSDKYDISVRLSDFEILAGNIDAKSKKYLLGVLLPKQNELNQIWHELNETDNAVAAEQIISNLKF